MADNVAKTVLGRNYCDNRSMAGYGSAWLYKEANETKYHLVVPTSELPTISGSVETFESNLLTCPNISQIEGKTSLEQITVNVLHHRDNARRLEALQGRTLDFMFIYKDGTARKFSGKIKYNPDTAGADVQNGVVTITPNSAVESTILDARSMIQPTVNFTSTVPERLTIGATGSEVIIDTDPSTATLLASVIDGATGLTSTDFTATFGTGANAHKLTISRGASSAGTYYGVVVITAQNSNYADYEISIAVDFTIA